MCCAVSDMAGNLEESMGEHGSHDMVSKGLLTQDGEERKVSYVRQCCRSSRRLGGSLNLQSGFS